MIDTRIGIRPLAAASRKRNDAFRDHATRIAAVKADDQRRERDKDRDDGGEPPHQVDLTV